MDGRSDFYSGVIDSVGVLFLMAIEIKDNPFYSNHVFSKDDLNRKVWQPTRWERFFIRFLPTYVQLADEYTFYYKRWNGRYFLIDISVRD